MSAGSRKGALIFGLILIGIGLAFFLANWYSLCRVGRSSPPIGRCSRSWSGRKRSTAILPGRKSPQPPMPAPALSQMPPLDAGRPALGGSGDPVPAPQLRHRARFLVDGGPLLADPADPARPGKSNRLLPPEGRSLSQDRGSLWSPPGARHRFRDFQDPQQRHARTSF